MIDTFQTRAPVALALCAVLAVLAAYAPPALGAESGNEILAGEDTERPDAPPAPVEGSAEWADLVVGRFAEVDGWDTEFVSDGKGDPEAVRLFLPSPLKTVEPNGNVAGVAVETVLPLSPPSYVNRFKKIGFGKGVDGSIAFQFADIGWNTAGQKGSVQPQIDILFHTRSLEEAEECPLESRNCKPTLSQEEIAKRLADRPPECFLPSGSVPLAEKAAPGTGLFNLASGPQSAPDNPAIIYGTYDDEIVFLGVSLTLENLQHAAQEGYLGERLSWPVNQPSRYRFAWWPRTIALEYRDDEKRFALSLEDFSKRKVRTSCK